MKDKKYIAKNAKAYIEDLLFKANIIEDYMENCGYTRAEAVVAASNLKTYESECLRKRA